MAHCLSFKTSLAIFQYHSLSQNEKMSEEERIMRAVCAKSISYITSYGLYQWNRKSGLRTSIQLCLPLLALGTLCVFMFEKLIQLVAVVPPDHIHEFLSSKGVWIASFRHKNDEGFGLGERSELSNLL